MIHVHQLFKSSCILFLLSVSSTSFSQVVVNTLQELQQYLDDDNVNVKLTPGTYTVTANDVSNSTIGKFWEGSEYLGNSFNVFLFEGNNSTYDFTGVIINIETEAAHSVGRVDFYEVRTIGSNILIKNLTVVDDGASDDAPSFRATDVVMDGANNRIEGCHFTIRGSFPYGYGDLFGKSGSNVIGHRKRSACLVRGKSNLVKNSTFICRSYGHGIFFQGAEDPMVDSCYVEGELRSTDNVLEEEGSGSPADNVNFQTIMGFNMRDLEGNYYFSLQEDGIRSYNAGSTIVDGIEYSRGVTDATVTNSTVVKMRSGVTIGWAGGVKYVENCTTLACESGYWVGGNTTVVDCKGDASVGTLLSEDVGRSNSTIELTLLDDYVEPLDGEVTAIYFAGSNHNVTLHDATTSLIGHIEIVIGGKRLAHRFMDGNGSTNLPLNYNANAINFINNSDYPIFIGDKAENTNTTTCGPVTDNGVNSSIITNTNCLKVTTCNNTTQLIEAECYDEMFGIETESGQDDGQVSTNIGFVHHEDWTRYNDIELGTINTFNARIATKNAGVLEVWIDGRDTLTGTLLTSIDVTSTGDWQSWVTLSESFNPVGGLHDVYLVFKGQVGYLFNLNWVGFTEEIVHIDCYGDVNGTANTDACGICSGGNTGKEADACLLCGAPWATMIDADNIPENVIDNDLNTRWSANGLGEYIELCVGDDPMFIEALDLAFFNGENRMAMFDVYVSLDGLNWITVLQNAVSSGNTLEKERFSFESVEAWKIKIVGKGNSDNNWNSITEVSWMGTITSVSSNNALSSLNTFPNPTENYVHVSAKTDISQYSLIDMTGNQVLNKSSLKKRDLNINLSDLSKGLYLLQIRLANGNVVIEKISKE